MAGIFLGRPGAGDVVPVIPVIHTSAAPEVVVHVATLLSIVVAYRARLAALVKGVVGGDGGVVYGVDGDVHRRRVA